MQTQREAKTQCIYHWLRCHIAELWHRWTQKRICFHKPSECVECQNVWSIFVYFVSLPIFTTRLTSNDFQTRISDNIYETITEKTNCDSSLRSINVLAGIQNSKLIRLFANRFKNDLNFFWNNTNILWRNRKNEILFWDFPTLKLIKIYWFLGSVSETTEEGLLFSIAMVCSEQKIVWNNIFFAQRRVKWRELGIGEQIDDRG